MEQENFTCLREHKIRSNIFFNFAEMFALLRFPQKKKNMSRQCNSSRILSRNEFQLKATQLN